MSLKRPEKNCSKPLKIAGNAFSSLGFEVTDIYSHFCTDVTAPTRHLSRGRFWTPKITNYKSCRYNKWSSSHSIKWDIRPSGSTQHGRFFSCLILNRNQLIFIFFVESWSNNFHVKNGRNYNQNQKTDHRF